MTETVRHSQFATTDKPENEVEAPARAAAPARARVLDWVKGEVTPPDLIRNQRPSVQASWWYAHYGEQNPAEGPGRVLSRLYALICLPARTLIAYADWIVERPLRLLLFVGLWALLAQSSHFAWLPLF